MSVSMEEQIRRAKLHLCRTCANKAYFLEDRGRFGVYCEKHRAENSANYKRWLKRTGPRKK